MAVKAEFRNERTGEIKTVKVGWSWVLFLFSGILGIPLFFRRLYMWGVLMAALWFANLIGPEVLSDTDEANGLTILLTVIGVGLAVYFGVKGNELTAKNYLENGWEFANPEDRATEFAKMKWSLD